MLSVIMLNVFMLNVVILNVVMLNVVMLCQGALIMTSSNSFSGKGRTNKTKGVGGSSSIYPNRRILIENPLAGKAEWKNEFDNSQFYEP